MLKWSGCCRGADQICQRRLCQVHTQHQHQRATQKYATLTLASAAATSLCSHLPCSPAVAAAEMRVRGCFVATADLLLPTTCWCRCCLRCRLSAWLAASPVLPACCLVQVAVFAVATVRCSPPHGVVAVWCRYQCASCFDGLLAMLLLLRLVMLLMLCSADDVLLTCCEGGAAAAALFCGDERACVCVWLRWRGASLSAES